MSSTHFFTWAQNDTPVHARFWRNLTTYAEHCGAELHVMLGRYRHFNNPYADPDEHKKESWADELREYGHIAELELPSEVVCRFDVRITPTASDPLSGMQLFGKGKSTIFGHPRFHARCFPTGTRTYPKLQYTTGACTIENYSATKVGAKAHEHHIFGFVIVEFDGKYFHMRHVNARSSDGAFIDSARGKEVRNGKVRRCPPAQALRVGDSHAHEQYEPAIVATEQMRDLCRPERVIVDDIYSHSAAGHRLERDNYEFQLKKMNGPTVSDELVQAWELIDRLKATDVMFSNHHKHLDEWLQNVDGRTDPANLEVWADCLARKCQAQHPAFEEWCRRYSTGLPDTRFWRRGEACIIGGVRHDHGHEGVGGARGTPNQWRRLGCKVTTAHTHVPSARDGHYCAGHTSDPAKHSYCDATKSGWMWANVMQDAYGKRQIINIVPHSPGLFRAA